LSSPECCRKPPRETAQRACRFQATSILGESNGQFCVDRNHAKRSVTGERNPGALSGLTQPKKQSCVATLFDENSLIRHYANVIHSADFENSTATLKLWGPALQRIRT